MEIVGYKWLLDTFGPIGLVVGAFISMSVWLWRNRLDVQKKTEHLDAIKDSLLEQYKEIVKDNTRALDQAREQDHVDKMHINRLLQEVRTLIDERVPRRGRD